MKESGIMDYRMEMDMYLGKMVRNCQQVGYRELIANWYDLDNIQKLFLYSAFIIADLFWYKFNL